MRSRLDEVVICCLLICAALGCGGGGGSGSTPGSWSVTRNGNVLELAYGSGTNYAYVGSRTFPIPTDGKGE